MNQQNQGEGENQGDTAAEIQGDTAPGVLQVVQSAYGWANGDVAPGEFVPRDEVIVDVDGDRLQACLMSEASTDDWDDPDMIEDSREHWQQALHRIEQMYSEVSYVRNALAAEYRKRFPPPRRTRKS